jgi:hypothetical protein
MEMVIGIFNTMQATRYTVRLSVVMNDFAASVTRHNLAAEDADDAVSKAIMLAEEETGRSGWELDQPLGVEETEQ